MTRSWYSRTLVAVAGYTSMVFSFSTLPASWLGSSNRAIAFSISTSLTEMLTRISGRTSLSKIKFRPLPLDSASNTWRRPTSRNSSLIGTV